MYSMTSRIVRTFSVNWFIELFTFDFSLNHLKLLIPLKYQQNYLEADYYTHLSILFYYETIPMPLEFLNDLPNILETN